MKKKAIGGILLLMLVVGMMSGCSVPPKEASDFNWYIVESPITGRYYEIAKRSSSAAMSEVTQAEYDAYISGLQK